MNRFIIDGFNMVYRSHFAFLKFSTASGMPSGCIYGFFSSLKSLRNKYPDFKFYVVWDNKAKRKFALFPEYKANRDPFRVSLPISDIKQALDCLNIIQVDCPDQEADDVIGSMVTQSNDGKDYIYSSDKDLQQLVVDGKVIVISPKVGKIPEKYYDEEAVKDTWGVTPKDLACFLAFRGDTSDNVPGVPTVPSKILATLVSKYKTPEAVYNNIAEEKLTEFQLKTIIQVKDQIFLNNQLIQLDKNLSCNFKTGTQNQIKLGEILKRYEIKKISSEDLVQLFDAETVFLRREGPRLKTISMFEEE